MDINQNILINSTDRLKEQNTLDQNSDRPSETRDLKNKKNSDILYNFKPNNKVNLKKSLNHKIKIKNSIKHYLTQDKNDNKISRNGLIINCISADPNILKYNSKENNNLYNNSKSVNSYINEEDNNSENDDTYRQVNKKEKKAKLCKTFTINKKIDELPILVGSKIRLTKKDKDNKLTINNCIAIKNSDENITSLHDKKNTNTINEFNSFYSMNRNGDNKMISINSYKYRNIRENYAKCLFCDLISDNEEYNSYFSCEHYFCKKCGKIFYEDIIESMIKNNNFHFLHCPVVYCSNTIPLPLTKLIISEKNYNELINNIDKNKSIDNITKDKKDKKDIFIMKTDMFENNEIFKNKIDSEYYKYLQKNVIDLNSYKKYIYFIQKSFIRCPFCKEYSLYGKIEGNFDKCLRCMKKYCKYCHKEFDNYHLDITKVNHCKVFYRTYKEYIQQKVYYKLLFNYLYVIGGYLFVLTFFIIKIKRVLRIRNTFKKIILTFFFFVLFLIFLPICIIIFPYFPLIISL